MTKTAHLAIPRCILHHQRRQISLWKQTTSQQAPPPAVALPPPKPFTDIPGPLALPMLRHSAHVLPRIGNFHHTVGLGLLEGLRRRYGDLVRLAKASRKRPVLYVFDPEMMMEVYKSKAVESPYWDRSPLQQQRKDAARKCPAHGEESKSLWSGVQAILQEKELLQSFEKSFDDIANEATARLTDLRHAENALNEELETELYRWALEAVGVLTLGIRLGCLDGPVHKPSAGDRKPEQTSLDDEILDECSLTKRSYDELTPAEQLIRCLRDISNQSFLVRSDGTLRKDSEIFNEALKTFDKQFSLIDHFLQKALVDLKSGPPRMEQAFLDRIYPLNSRILPLAADIFLAGVDPLVQTALSMFYHLSLNPAQQQRAHDEVHWVAASIDAGAGCPERQYIAACAREAMRLHPVTGGVVRRSKTDISVGGYHVPSGVDIVLAHGVTSKCEKEFRRAKAFVPERWCSDCIDPLKASKAHPLASMPFGELCPASGVITMMLTSLATRVLDKYRLEWQGPTPNIMTTGVNRLLPPFYFVLQNAA